MSFLSEDEWIDAGAYRMSYVFLVVAPWESSPFLYSRCKYHFDSLKKLFNRNR